MGSNLQPPGRIVTTDSSYDTIKHGETPVVVPPPDRGRVLKDRR